MITAIFDQVDTWCLREARPMGAVGGQAVNSQFPPPAATLIGAVRTLIGDALNVDWSAFAKGSLPEISTLLGDAKSTGNLTFGAPYMTLNGTPLFPAPAHLMTSSQGKQVLALRLGEEPVQCDLGRVLLPDLEGPMKEVAGAKSLSGHWLTETGWQALCQGRCPEKEQVVSAADLWVKETRLGIARNKKGVAEDTMLYQTEHVRLRLDQSTSIALDIDGIPENIQADLLAQRHCIRLGGEGRMAQVHFKSNSQAEQEPVTFQSDRALLCLPFGAHFDQWCPPGFEITVRDGVDVWQGNIGGVNLEIESFAADKPKPLGGWDSAKRQPKAVVNLQPPGSVYFIRCDHLPKLQAALKTTRLGSQTDFGFGLATLLPRTE